MNLNGLQTQSKYELKTHDLKNEMENLDSERKGLEKSLLIETIEKENTKNILEQTQSIIMIIFFTLKVILFK